MNVFRNRKNHKTGRKQLLKCVCGLALVTGLATQIQAAPFTFAGPAQNDIELVTPTSIVLNVASTDVIDDLNISIDLDGGFETELDIDLSHGGYYGESLRFCTICYQ